MSRFPFQARTRALSGRAAPQALNPTGRVPANGNVRTRVLPSMSAVIVMAASMVVLWPTAPGGLAAQGDLDPTFSRTGQAVTDMSGQFAQANAMATQTDGKVVVVGMAGPAKDPLRAADMIVARFTTDGGLDPDFGKAGLVPIDIYGARDEARGVAIQPDGKIVVVGYTEGNTPSRDLVVLRLDRNGAIDTSFNDGTGRFVFDDGNDEEVNAVAIQPDGRIVVGGRDGFQLLLLRLSPDGGLDLSFNESGITRPGAGVANALTIDGQGRIVVVGGFFGDFQTFRLLDNGVVDADFNPDNGGFNYEDLADSNDEARAVALTPDGKIIVAGRAGAEGGIVRYESSGVLDDSFRGGKFTTDLGGSEGATLESVISLESGLVVAGRAGQDIGLAQFTSDGEPATGFGERGVVRTDGFGGADNASTVRLLPGDTAGKLAVAGTIESGLGSDLAALRYNPDGSPDKTFAAIGRSTANVPSSGDELNAMVVRGDGSATVAGYSATGNGWDFTISRYDSSGNPDFGFGEGGHVVLDLGGDDRAYGLAEAQGRVTAVGTSDGLLTVVRLLIQLDGTDGGRDPGFGDNGVVKLRLTEDDSTAVGKAVVVDGEGRAVVAGTVDGGVFVARLNPDGTPDTSFGDEGFLTDFVGTAPQISKVLLQGDGRIVVVGDIAPSNDLGFTRPASVSAASAASSVAAAQFDGDRDFLLLRYNADGTPDDAWGFDGERTYDLQFGNDEALDAYIQDGGNIVVVGKSFKGFVEPGIQAVPNLTSDIGLIRVSGIDGARDASFGAEGVTITDLGGRDEGLAIVSGGTIRDNFYVGGQTSNTAGNTDFVVLEYDFDGTLLTDGFGTGGSTVTDFGGNDQARAIGFSDNGGTVLLAGTTSGVLNTKFALARYDDDGRLDPDFNSGIVTTTVAGDLDEARAVVAQPDGKVVVAGESHAGPAGDFALARYNTDGTLDTSFGRGGRVFTDIAGQSDGINAVLLQPDGKIVAGGVASRGPKADFAIARYNADGSLDDTFGADGSAPGTGVVRIDFGSISDTLRAIVLQPDGRIVAGGTTEFPGAPDPMRHHDFALARVTAGGALDGSFGEGGEVTLDFGENDDDVNALALQPDGRIVAAGSTALEFQPQLWIARFEPDGDLDATFGDEGQVIEGNQVIAPVSAVAVQADGRIVVAGNLSPVDSPSVPYVNRYLPDGKIDNSFSAEDGRDNPNFGPDDAVSALLVQPDGAIVVAGESVGDGDNEADRRDVALLRYRTDGVPDPDFGTAGLTRGGQTGFADAGLAVALAPDGHILVAGPAQIGKLVGGPSPLEHDSDFTVLRFEGGPTGPVGPVANLSVQLTSSTDSGSPRVGAPLRFGVTVTNGGPSPATGVVVSDELPAGLNLLGTTSSQGTACTLDAGRVRCALGDLAADTTAGVTITVEPTAPGVVTNTVAVTSEEADPDPSDNTASVTVTIRPRSTLRANPAIVQVGRVVRVIGTDFEPNSQVELGYPGRATQVKVTTDASGNFSTPFVIFVETTPGARPLEARTPTEVLSTVNLLLVTDTLAPPNFVGRK